MEKITYKDYMPLNKKLKSIYSKKPDFLNLPKTSYIKNLVNKIESEGLKELNAIKDYLLKNKEKITSKNLGIITNIINAKQDGQKIYLNTSLFTKKINTYFCGSNVRSKCLTNETLNLLMNFSQLLDSNKEQANWFKNAEMINVKVTSENFYLDESTVRGYIQDYDSDFSAIASPKLDKSEVASIVRNKPNEGSFLVGEQRYIYYGNSDIFFITKEDLNNDDAIEKFNQMKFLRNKRDGQFVLGERKVYISGNDKLCYIDKEFKPEEFCPAFWISDKEIQLNYLFTFEYDYNDLFSDLSISEIKGVIDFPNNMCYWDTINECFQFLSIFSITNNFVKEVNRNNIVSWCDTYFTFRPIITSWKNNQLLYERILQDFLYAFLNNSELKRFANLLDKVNKYIEARNELNSNVYSNDVISFFNNIPFAQMITKQLTPEVFGLADKIKTVLTNYLDGKNPNSMVDNIRTIAKSIHALTPRNGIGNAAFPFIVADGGLLGGGFNFNELGSDPLFQGIFKRYQNIQALKQRSKKKVAEMTELLSNYDLILTEYLEKYIKNYFEKKGLQNKGIPITPIISDVRGGMKADVNSSKKVIEDAMKLKSSGKAIPKSAKNVFVDKFIEDFLEERKDVKATMKKAKKNINAMEIESEDDEDAKSVQPVNTYSLRNRAIK